MRDCEVMLVYLTIKQHDMFRTLLMGFEIPFRTYISKKVVTVYKNVAEFEAKMQAVDIQPSAPFFLKDVLPQVCRNGKLRSIYEKFLVAETSVGDTVCADEEVPMVGNLNLVTFALTSDFADLYSLFTSYSDYCNLAEKYRYARNKLNHPRCRTLEESHLVPVLSFIKDICNFLEDKYFIEKRRDDLLREITTLQQRKITIPIEKNNLADMPYGESKLVCRDSETELLKTFVYGNPEDLRKRHSFCIYGYGGVGKTALVLEVIKQIVQDVVDEHTVNDYKPAYLFFFSAKKRKLSLAQETGKVIEQQMRWHFETAEELISLIHTSLGQQNFKKFHDEGLIIIDNLETLLGEERAKIKNFIETQTPSEMQFIITSRHSEEYETNYKLAGFESETGKVFITKYSDENALELSLTDSEIDEILDLAKGNTLVLVLCLRRLSQQLSTVNNLKTDFSSVNTWKSLRKGLAQMPPNAYEVISEFMFKDTFEQIEIVFSEDQSLFYQILKVFAVIQDEAIDINTVCLLTDCPYPKVEVFIDILCNYLILEKRKGQFILNSFAEKYIVSRFIPDSETYQQLSSEIMRRRNEIQASLEQLEVDKKERSALAKILKDWAILTDSDRITAAKIYRLYGDAKSACDRSSRFKVEDVLERLIHDCQEAEKITAHPYVKYQKARVLQLIDRSNVLSEKHSDEIIRAYQNAVYVIKMVEQYAVIQQTKSYASMLWLFGQYLSDMGQTLDAIRYLEESKESFEQQNITDQEYYQNCSKLGALYLDHYLEDQSTRITYLRRSRQISRMLQNNYDALGKARSYAAQLKYRLSAYGPH